MKFLITTAIGVLCIASMFPIEGFAQIVHTTAFTETLNRAGITYTESPEQWLHVVLSPEDDFMRYDLVLQNDRNDFEVRYRIHDEKFGHTEVPPSIEVSRLIASIASNEQLQDIIVSIPPREFLQASFNADHGMVVRFTPKKEFSEKTHGALLTLYAQDKPAIDVVILYYDSAYDPLTMYRSIRFVKPLGD